MSSISRSLQQITKEIKATLNENLSQNAPLSSQLIDGIYAKFKKLTELSSQSQNLKEKMEAFALASHLLKINDPKEKVYRIFQNALKLTSTQKLVKLSEEFLTQEMQKATSTISVATLDERLNLCAIGTPWIQETTHQEEASYLFQKIQEIGFEEIDSVIEDARVMIPPDASTAQIADIFYAASKVPKEIRSSLCKEMTFCTQSWFGARRSSQNIEQLFRLISHLPQKNRLEILKFLKTWIENPIEKVEALCEIICDMPSRERPSVLAQVKDWTTDATPIDHVISLLQSILEVPFSERKYIFPYASEWIKQLILQSDETLEAGMLFKVMQNFLRKDRDLVFKGITPWIKKDFSLVSIAHCLEIFGGVPSCERAELLQIAQDWILKDVSLNSFSKFVKAVHNIPSEERVGVFSAASQFKRQNTPLRHLLYFFKTIQKIPSQERDQLFVDCAPFIQDKMKMVTIAQLLEGLYDIPRSVRQELLQTPYLQDIRFSLIFLLPYLRNLNPKNREDFCLVICRFFPAHITVSDAKIFLEIMADFPGERREEACTIFDPYLRGLTFQEICPILKTIKEIPPEKWILVKEETTAYIQEGMDAKKILYLLRCFSHDSIKEVLSSYHGNPLPISSENLRTLLESAEPNLFSLLTSRGFPPIIYEFETKDEGVLEDFSLNGLIFLHCNLQGFQSSSSLLYSDFIHCKIQSVAFTQTSIQECRFESCEIEEAIFLEATIEDVLFEKTAILHSCFEEASLSNVLFDKVSLAGTYFLGAYAEETTIQNSNLEDALFFETIEQIDFPENDPSKESYRLTSLMIGGLCSPTLAGVSVPEAFQKLDTLVTKRGCLRIPFSNLDLGKTNKEVETLLEEIRIDPEQSFSIAQQLIQKVKNNPGKYPECFGIIEKAKYLTSQLNAVLLPGGEDIPPSLYGQVSENLAIWGEDYDRSIFEIALIHECYNKGIPFLGICRGFQIANVYFGGGLIQNVENQHQKQLLSLNPNEKNSLIAQVLKDSVMGICAHHQGIFDTTFPSEHLSATSFYQNLVKSAEGRHGASVPMILCQFHPEFYHESMVEGNENTVEVGVYKRNDLIWKILSDSALAYKAKRKALLTMQERLEKPITGKKRKRTKKL